MDGKSSTVIKGVKELGNEMSAWENRVVILQNEAEGLKRRNESVRKELESTIALAGQEVAKRREESRAEMAKVLEAAAKLEAEKAEFQVILTAFKKERNEFEREKTKTLDIQKDAIAMRDKASNFAVCVRREAEKL